MQNFTKRDLMENKEITHVYTVQTTIESKTLSLPYCDFLDINDGLIGGYLYSLFWFLNQISELSQNDETWLTPKNIDSMTPGMLIANYPHAKTFNKIKYHSPARNIDQLYFYSVSECYNFSSSLKKSFDVLKLVQHYYQNPIENIEQLQQLLHGLNQSVDYEIRVGHHPQEKEILQLTIPIANYALKQIHTMQTTVLGENFDYNNLHISIQKNKIIKNHESSLDLNSTLAANSLLISQLLKQSKFLKFYEHVRNHNLYHVFILDNCTKDEMQKIKDQAKASMSSGDYKLTVNYVACRTDDFHLILKLLISGKFSYIDQDTMNVLRAIL